MYSLAVCSRWPVRLERETELPTGRAMLATVAAPGGDVRVLVVDGESSPFVRRTPRLRAASDICRAARDVGAPIHIIAGDFNALGRSVGFDDFRAAGYAPASASTRGWRATWPSPCPIYDIDHVWLSDAIAVTGCELFTNTISDHRGTAVRIQLQTRD
jgi:endonuclease/exonuclease/phosphatase family metal-dependent hydrolase